MPRSNPSDETKRKRNTSQEDDDEANMESTQPLTKAEEGKLSSEELKAYYDDAFCLSWDLVDDVVAITRSRDRQPSLEKNAAWNRFIKTTSFYKKTEACIKAGNCKPLSSNKSLMEQEEDTQSTQSSLSEEEEDTQSTQSSQSEEEDNSECGQPLAEETSSEEEDNMESMKEEASSEEEDNMESTEENASSEEEDNLECVQPLAEETSSEEEDDMEHTEEEASSEEEEGKKEWSMRISLCRRIVELPIKFGSYSSATAPVCIPYHLYLLVKKAVDIMKLPEWHNNTNDVRKLNLVEGKIYFFCRYFYSHLPTGWEYDRDTASTVVASYDLARKPIYNMDGYTPISDSTRFPDYHEFEYDRRTKLSRREMIKVMGIIHSRETPEYWKLTTVQIMFYCKICSCFGIDYACLEDASEDDVCLMDVGKKSD